MPRSSFAQRGPSRRGYTHLSTEYCQNAHSPRMLREGARSVHGPCLVAPGLIILSRHVRRGSKRAGSILVSSGMRVLAAVTRVDNPEHTRRAATEHDARASTVNLNEAVT